MFRAAPTDSIVPFRSFSQFRLITNINNFARERWSLAASSRPVSISQPSAARASGMKRGGHEHENVRISKEMSKLLRHKPPPGVMDGAGWVSLPVLLRHLRSHPTEEQVRRIVESCEKKRFVIDDTVTPPRIRAAQGHSVELADAVLEPVTDPEKVPVAVHVTSASSWEAIQASGELLRMKRTHIHFATAPHHLRKNNWAEVYLQLDLTAALAQGLEFFLSTNGVLLCQGPVPVTLLKQVKLQDLPEPWPSRGLHTTDA